MRLRDSVVVITGASSGIGRATALAFADKGAALVLAARRESALDKVASECRARGARALAVPTDVSDAKAVEELARRAVDKYGRINVWVNDASVTMYGPFADVPLEDFKRVLDVNVLGYVHGARSALTQFRAQGSGVLVNVASVLGVVPQPYATAYVMSKAAVVMLGASLRQELRLDGARSIDVCTVLPSTTDTPIFTNAANYTGRATRALPPVYPPEEVARTIVRLARRPRPEVVVGKGGKALVKQMRATPHAVERSMAAATARGQLSSRAAADTDGNLFTPGPGEATVHGGWHGRGRTTLRRTALLGVAAAAVVAASRRSWLSADRLQALGEELRRRAPEPVARAADRARSEVPARAAAAASALEKRYPQQADAVRSALRDELPRHLREARERAEPAMTSAASAWRRMSASRLAASLPWVAPRQRTLLQRLRLRPAPRTPAENLVDGLRSVRDRVRRAS